MSLSRIFSRRLNFPLCVYFLACVLILTTVTFLYRQFHSLEIFFCEDGAVRPVYSKAEHVEGFLHELGFILRPGDRVFPELAEPLEKGMQITVERAFPVTITTATGSFKHYSHAATVYEVLQEIGIPFAGNYVEPEPGTLVYAGKEILVLPEVLALDTVEEAIACPVEKRLDQTVYKGRTKLVQEGKEGRKELKYRLVYAGKKELLRALIAETVVAEPVPAIVAVGTKPLPAAPVIIASRGESIEGMASWYGAAFHGRKTSSKEVFDQNGFTAAHRSLPFGTYVKVTFLQTGKSTLVRINDRGPGDPGRVIDLSRAAAEEIGLRARGVGRVSIEVVEVGK